MANWTKKAHRAAAPILEPGEQVVAGANVTYRQFAVSDGGFTGGLVAGGVVGAAAGRVWDQHLEGKRAAEEAGRPKTFFEELPPRQVSFPETGALGVATDCRLILFELSAMGKPGDLFFEIPLNEISAVYERDIQQKLSRGMPQSRQVLMVFDDQTTLSLFSLSSGLSRKWIEAFTGALRPSASTV